MADIGESCKNGPWQEIWTCPNCYHDHDGEVNNCAGCGVALSCTIEREPIAVCTIIDPAERDEA